MCTYTTVSFYMYIYVRIVYMCTFYMLVYTLVCNRPFDLLLLGMYTCMYKGCTCVVIYSTLSFVILVLMHCFAVLFHCTSICVHVCVIHSLGAFLKTQVSIANK